MKHFYTSKTWSKGHYKILCTGARQEFNKGDVQPVAVPHNTTCPKCLDILIPKEEAKVQKMRDTRAAFDEKNKFILKMEVVRTNPVQGE